MKNIVTMCSVFAATAGTALAGIAPVSYSNPLIGVDGSQDVQADPTGNAFFVAPGLGNANGFFLSASGPMNDTSAGASADFIGMNVDGVSSLYATSSVVDNTGGNYDISILLYTDGADLAPAGFVDGGGFALDSIGFFMGANGGGTPLSFSDVAMTNSATIELFNAAGPAGGPFDISGFSEFSALGGGWNGSLGVSFGPGTAGIGITAIELLVNVTVVPAPAGLATLALGGLVATRRRRN